MTDQDIAFIFARGGSKRLPGKNVADLSDKPLIAWTIEAALSSNSFHRVFVSTEDPAISEVATSWGAYVPFQRPSELAQDSTPSIEVALHALEWFEREREYLPRYFVLLQPTSPFRTSTDIDKALQTALTYRADSVVSMCEAVEHPYWTKSLDSQGKLCNICPSVNLNQGRQSLPRAYAFNGAIYIATPNQLRDHRSFITQATFPYIMPVQRSLDIDTEWDLELARLIMKKRLEDKQWTECYHL